MPGDSGQREEETPLVVDDVTAVEEAMHDAIDEDDYDTLQYLNTGAYDDRGLMAQQYEYSGLSVLSQCLNCGRLNIL